MTHPTHRTRYSDSSLYDEVCIDCGARDWVPMNSQDKRMEEPCPYGDKRCNFCKKPLDQEGDETSIDCGGDCLECMARIIEDPDCIASMYEITLDEEWATVTSDLRREDR